MLTKAQEKATQKYNSRVYSQLHYFVRKEQKPMIVSAAKKCNQSINNYIHNAVITSIDNESNHSMYDMAYDAEYETTKSNLQHLLRSMGDIAFVIKALDEDLPVKMFRQNHLYGVYTVSMLDYLCRTNKLPSIKKYKNIRKIKFKNKIWPADVMIEEAFSLGNALKENALKNAIPEFSEHNIIEGDIRNVK